MLKQNAFYQPGSLVRARGREWVAQPGSDENILILRPLGGSEADTVTLIPALEWEAPTSATFAPPTPDQIGNFDAARILRDALRLKLRNGAGPFRSFGNIAVDPRIYQLVPLMMALRLATVRLLIADDVGIGKTIEAGLILRELYDRDEIDRASILCPPHLVEQWQQELADRFNIDAVAVTARNINRLERECPPGTNLFQHHPFTVVSLDYIKTDAHRHFFLNNAPPCIIVDEAHTCTLSDSNRGRNLRYRLLKDLVADEERHLIMLTATPHSGKDDAFYNLLSLLDPEFATLQHQPNPNLRNRLRNHFIMRRRRDIQTIFEDDTNFPTRRTRERTYDLTGEWGDFFDQVQQYCDDLKKRLETEGRGNELIAYAAIALLRCISSSPKSAERALRTRLANLQSVDALVQLAEEDDTESSVALFDDIPDDMTTSDEEPKLWHNEAEQLEMLIAQAQHLTGRHDPKLTALIQEVRLLLNDGFHPVVFCRYVATAHYVADELKEAFPSYSVGCVTGEFAAEERKDKVLQLGETADKRILVATDCLSEGINLQRYYSAVIHYDLAWNPTRHEQREGRVDRFGQPAPEVRSVMLYGDDNPVDKAVVRVILHKAERIRTELGITVPVPEDNSRIRQALLAEAMTKRRDMQRTEVQTRLDIEAETATAEWQSQSERHGRISTFAHQTERVEEIYHEWQVQQRMLGSSMDIQRFIEASSHRLDATLEHNPRGDSFTLNLALLPWPLQQRLQHVGLTKTFKGTFSSSPPEKTEQVTRSHPLVATIADWFLETAFAKIGDTSTPRAAVLTSSAVQQRTTVFLVRLRHQISTGKTKQLLAEEAALLAIAGRSSPTWLDMQDIEQLLMATPEANMDVDRMKTYIQQGLEQWEAQQEYCEAFADQRAAVLKQDHMRVRTILSTQRASRVSTSDISVQACLPLDLVGIYVMLPAAL